MMRPAYVVLAVVMLLAACLDGDGPGTSASSTRTAEPTRTSPDSSIDSLQSLGEALYSAAEIDSAQSLFRVALDLAQQGSDSVGIAHALTWLAKAGWRLGDLRDARRLGEESLDVKLRFGLEEELFDTYNILGLIAGRESRLLDASDWYELATEVAEATGDSTSLCKVRSNLAEVHTYLGDYRAARDGFLRARQLARAVGDPRCEGRALIGLGMLDQEEGSTLTAIDHLEQAGPLLAAAEDPLGEQYRVGHLGSAYAEIGDLGRAIALLENALQQARAHGVRQDEASNLELLARLNMDAGHLRRALELFSEAKKIDVELGLRDELAMDLLAEAEIYQELGNLTLARKNAEEALSIHREIGARMREIEDLVTLAELSHEAGFGEDARFRLGEAEQLATELDVPAAYLEVALTRARLAELDNDPRAVLSALAPVIQDLPRGRSSREWEVQALRARAHAAQGRLDSAAAVGRQAIAAVERVRGELASGVLRTGYQRQREAVYADLVMVLLRMGEVAEAFEIADAARGRVLVERLASVRDEVIGSPGTTGSVANGERLLWRIQDLSRYLEELGEESIGDESAETVETIDRLQGELERARAEYSAALVSAAEAAERDPEAAALLGIRSGGAVDVQQALEPGEALLEYLLTPDRLLLFVVRADTILHFESEISRDSLASRVRLARGLLGQPNLRVEASYAVLMGLYEVLIAPAANEGALAGVAQLMVVPHAELNYLPIAALRDGEAGRYVVEQYSIIHLPTASALPALRHRDGRSLAGVHAQAFAPFPGGLPASEVEVRAVADAVEDTRLRTGAEATERMLREGLNSATVVHVATHGILNALNPMFSRLELAAGVNQGESDRSRQAEVDPQDDGRLEVHELLGMRIESPFVFLSGCETGTSAAWATNFAGGEESATLAQAFLHAGAHNVVATLWPIEDEGAASFTGAFYRELGSRSPAGAMALAQRAMISHPLHGAPHYWAAYRLSGSGWLPTEPQEGPRVSVESKGQELRSTETQR